MQVLVFLDSTIQPVLYIRKDSMCCFEQIQEATPYKIAAVPPISHTIQPRQARLLGK